MKQFFPIPATSQSHPSLPFLCPIGKSVVAPLAEWGGAVATHVELFQISIIGDCHDMKPKLYLKKNKKNVSEERRYMSHYRNSMKKKLLPHIKFYWLLCYGQTRFLMAAIRHLEFFYSVM